MRLLQASDVLLLWERGVGLHSIDRALATLAAAEPELPADDLARLPLGDRDARLLMLRRATFGDRLDVVERCPECDTQVEFELRCSALLATGGETEREWTIEHGGVRLTLRALDSLDAAAAATAGRDGGVEAAREVLLRRAVVAAERGGEPVPPERLDPGLIVTVGASVLEHDRLAELLLDVTCPSCGHAWQPVLDVASFVWAELAARAERLLANVHALARVYGWSEAEVLGLSEPRRAAYLALVAE